MGTGNKAESLQIPGWLLRVLVGRNPRRTMLRIAVLVGVCLPLFHFVLRPVRIEGPSMEPTYHDHSINFINLMAFAFGQPQRGQVVAIRTTDMSIMYMKRIVALPGETIAFHRGCIYINGQLLPEPYLKKPCDWEIPPRTLGPAEYYVVGDNRSMPETSHEKGIVNRVRIVGKVLL